MSIQNKYNKLKLRSTKDLSEAHVRITELEKQSESLQLEIEELQNNSGGGDFIPLTGTEEGKSVNGDIEMDTNVLLKHISGDGEEFTISPYQNMEGELPTGLLIKAKEGGTNISRYISISEYGSPATIGYTDDDLLIVSTLSVGDLGIGISSPETSRGFYSSQYFGENYDDNTYVQKKYVDKINSYSTTETKTGGKWIDDKPIYRLVKLTVDPDPSDIETRFPDIIVGSYIILEYTKTID